MDKLPQFDAAGLCVCLHAYAQMRRREERLRKGTNGVSTNGVTANLRLCDRGTFRVLPLAYFYLPKSARASLCPQSVRMHYFCSGPIKVLTPFVRSQRLFATATRRVLQLDRDRKLQHGAQGFQG